MSSSPLIHFSQSFWQSPIWEDILRDSHQCILTVRIRISHTEVTMEVRQIGMGFVAGFLLGTVSDLSTADIDSILQEARALQCIFVQIEPLSGHIETTWYPPYRSFLVPHTRVIDLEKSEADILSAMHEKWRYNIRLAGKRWILCRWVDPTPENIDTWMQLLTDTTSRDGFSQNSRQYYEVFLRELEKSATGGLLFAYFWDRVIAAGIFVYFEKQAIYYYGASTSDREMRKHMAPYLLQWEAICEAKRRKCQSYDFLGIADPAHPDGHLRWVSEFKEKFGWEVITLPQKVLFPLSWRYRVFLGMRQIKKIFSK